ncbi:unnamed protein product [Adineta ricciae]|uniref:NHL repeat containing protein-like protein n=1 Tax=Adineta ricciae TaxID=249248 RepID=A0A816DS47_ADIRI|nr:unnamed protein product [Adineta ricciae]
MIGYKLFIIIEIIFGNTKLILAFNQPNFCPTADWDPIGITFSNETTVGKGPHFIFITKNNSIYVHNQVKREFIEWHEGSIYPTKLTPMNINALYSLFVATNGDIYYGNNLGPRRIDKWIAESNTNVTVIHAQLSLNGLFIDTNDSLYFSLSTHEVMRKSLHDPSRALVRMAGTGAIGSRFNELNMPRGIFVDTNFDLYIADSGNHRVQLVRLGQSIGMPVAGDGTINPTISLSWPNMVILDAQKYLFILDVGNDRIVGSGPNGFRCLVGCRGTGTQSFQLSIPFSFAFDRSGNIFVADQHNHRIQKFSFLEKSCTTSMVQPKFCATAEWNPIGNTFAVGSMVETIQIHVWHEGTHYLKKTIPINDIPASFFVANNNDIYIASRYQPRVSKWIAENGTLVTVSDFSATCECLFIDSNDTLYCGLSGKSQVVKKYVDDMTLVRAAGTGVWGSNLDQIRSACGIFVDTNFDLYIADCENHRVHLFQLEQTVGIVVAGYQSKNPTIDLRRPTVVVLDVEKYLFIVDMGNHRIVGSGVNGFRCLVGCRGKGSQPHQLDTPVGLSFDTLGNMFVVDGWNNRIQNFSFLEKSCGKIQLVR